MKHFLNIFRLFFIIYTLTIITYIQISFSQENNEFNTNSDSIEINDELLNINSIYDEKLKKLKTLKDTINKIAVARGRKLTCDEREEIIDDLNQEFMITGSFLNGLHKETKEFPGDKELV